MPRPTGPALLVLIPILLCGFPLPAADLPDRTPWADSKILGTPEPPFPYRTRVRFARHAFAQPIDLAPLPGTGLLAIAELGGRIRAFSAADDEAEPILLFEARQSIPDFKQLYSVTADPDFARNRRFYLFYKTADNDPLGSSVAGFEMRGEGKHLRLDPASRRVLVQWFGGGHNGGSVQFGPDGMLYFSTGDGSVPWPPDTMNVGQNLDNLLSSVLRIDVRDAGGPAPYRVPPDNPFVNTPGARPEVWAFGFRNPWRFSFDRKTGALWTGDVGWELWEMVHRVERGGNYGWAVMEGPQIVRTDVLPGPGEIRPPVAVHPHTEARSITGGYVYRGTKLPELSGFYLYGDYETGKLWGLNAEDPAPAPPRLLCDTPLNPVSFGQDEKGEIYLLDFSSGVYEILRQDPSAKAPPFPKRLGEAGLFRDIRAQSPAPGVVPYSIHSPLWVGGLKAEHWIGLPGGERIRTDRGWRFSKDTVFAQTLSHPGPPARRIETRLMHFDGDEWHAYSYRWRDDGSDADLVDADGREEIYTFGENRFRHRFEARGTCLVCHNFWSGYVLGFNAPQLKNAGGRSLKDWFDRGYLEKPPPDAPALADPRNPDASLDARARSWLHTHCAHCHRREAGGSASLLLAADLKPERMHLFEEKPVQGDFGLKDARLVALGDPIRSVLYYRLATSGVGHMPRLGSDTIDEAGLELIYQWIVSTRPDASPEPLWQKLPRPLEEMLSDPALSLLLRRQVALGAFGGEEKKRILAQALASPRPEIRGLFERWAEIQPRPDRLGPQPKPEQILSLAGDAARGRELFFSPRSAVCRACHRVGEEGGIIGPDLSAVGKRLKREELLESLLDPARRVEPAWRLYRLKTRNGSEQTGTLAERDEKQVRWRDAAGNLSVLPAGDIESLSPLPGSLMPAMLLQDFTAQEAADLIDFLKSLQ